MANLFNSGPLEQNTGLLKERWGQEGSEVVNIKGDYTTNGTMYTVTTGKTLYITSIQIYNRAAANLAHFTLKDGVGGSNKFGAMLEAVQGAQSTSNLSTPLEFNTDVYFYEDTAGTSVILTLTGWEE